MSPRIISFFGIFVLLGIAWLFSKNRKAINYKTVLTGTGLQLLFAVLILKVPLGRHVFQFFPSPTRARNSFSAA